MQENTKHYTRYLKQHRDGIDHYANLDVIGNPVLTCKHQQFLEGRGLEPVPVVHFNERYDLTWLRHYVRCGYKFIALGGLTKDETNETKRWLDMCFDYLKDKDIRIHGFGVTGWGMLTRYGWTSVDSSTWAQRGRFGEILVPRQRNNTHVFSRPPHTIGVTPEHTDGLHFDRLRNKDKNVVIQWLRSIGVNHALLAHSHNERAKANVRFFAQLEADLQSWHPLTIYLAGGGNPEQYTNQPVAIMTTFYNVR